jgi:amino acid permease
MIVRVQIRACTALTPQLVAWPLSGLFGIALHLTLAELASAYPVSGAMASWAWKLARGGVGYERQWGWLMGGMVLGGHMASVGLPVQLHDSRC